jgi:5'-phosphate synthase pdxT subunit
VSITIGVLAIQGVAPPTPARSHEPVTGRLGPTAGDLAGLGGLVLPAANPPRAEEVNGLDAPLAGFLASAGRCSAPAGAICSLGGQQPAADLARRARHRRQRNAWHADRLVRGAADGDAASPFAGLRCVFIRAPRITRTGPNVRVHARVNGAPVLVNDGPVWAATFHRGSRTTIGWRRRCSAGRLRARDAVEEALDPLNDVRRSISAASR